MYFSEVPLRIRTGEYPCSTVQLVKLYGFSTLICLLKNHQKHCNKFQPGNAIFQELILISSLIEVFGQQIMKGWATLIVLFGLLPVMKGTADNLNSSCCCHIHLKAFDLQCWLPSRPIQIRWIATLLYIWRRCTYL